MNWPSRHDHSCGLGRKATKQTNKTILLYQTRRKIHLYTKVNWSMCWGYSIGTDKQINLMVNLLIFSYPLVLTFVLGAQKEPSHWDSSLKYLQHSSCTDPENSVNVCVCVWGGGPDIFKIIKCISQRAVRTSPEKQMDRRGSVPVFLRKHIATCDFPGGVRFPWWVYQAVFWSNWRASGAKWKDWKIAYKHTICQKCAFFILVQIIK